MTKVDDGELRQRLEQQAKRIRKAERDKPTLLAQTVFTGTLGLLLVLPIIVGAYVGHWLDRLGAEYSVRWTLGLILLGVVIGSINVYLFIKERP
jgi:ATP synthase protein I